MNPSEPAKSSTPLLSLRQCTMRFGGLTAVSNFDLDVGCGELVGLIGPNGAGKTTVFNLITGVYEPTEGTVVFDGKSIHGEKAYTITAQRSIHRSPRSTRNDARGSLRTCPTFLVFPGVRT